MITSTANIVSPKTITHSIFTFNKQIYSAQITLKIYSDETFLMYCQNIHEGSSHIFYFPLLAGKVAYHNGNCVLSDAFNKIKFECYRKNDGNILLKSNWVYLDSLVSDNNYNIDVIDDTGRFVTFLGDADKLEEYYKICKNIDSNMVQIYEANKQFKIDEISILKSLDRYQFLLKDYEIIFETFNTFTIYFKGRLMYFGKYNIDNGIIELIDNRTEKTFKGFLSKNLDFVCPDIYLSPEYIVEGITFLREPKSTSPNEK
jgi:hypothetical protein